MMYVFYCILFIVGYLVGFLTRKIFARLQWGNTTCNIQKTGSHARLVGGIFFAVMAIYFHIPYLLVLAGFMTYESRARWCVVRNFQ